MKPGGTYTTVGAIIEKEGDPTRPIVVQIRWKEEDNPTNGLWEIPAGHIDTFEHPFDALRREVKEECGLSLTKIWPNDELRVNHPFTEGLSWTPFCVEACKGCTRMGLVFICKGTGSFKLIGDIDAKEPFWMPFEQLKETLEQTPEKWFFFHLAALKKYIKAREEGKLWGEHVPITTFS